MLSFKNILYQESVDAAGTAAFLREVLREVIGQDIAKINRNTNTDKTSTSLEKAKGHIQDFLECGLSDVNTPIKNDNSLEQWIFFRHNSSSKELLVGLSETYSNNYKIIRDFVKSHAVTPVNTDVDPAITDQSYNPNCIVKSIKQQQKTLSELEIQTICERYKNGVSSYELAKEFNCHRRTITDTLGRNGVEVSHQAIAKPELVKRIIELYAGYKTPKEVGAIVGIGGDTVRKVLKENGIYIRKSWEYPKK